MAFDFQKFHDNWWNSKTDEEKARIIKHDELVEENTFYKTITMLDDEYMKVKYGQEHKEVHQDVKLYRYVDGDNKVDDKVMLSFGGYRECGFDARFVYQMLERLEDPEIRFSIDTGNEVYVKNNEIKRIIREAVEALKERGIELVEDYYPTLTNSNFGGMLQGMGLS